MVEALKLRVAARVESKISREFLPIAIFCAIGLLLSLAVLIADQYIPGEWF
jgi:hypothetical protein